jgi:hypothetical protein
MVHLYARGSSTQGLYNKSWCRHHEARAAAATQTPSFARPRCPGCFNAELLPYAAEPSAEVLFAVLTTVASLGPP